LVYVVVVLYGTVAFWGGSVRVDGWGGGGGVVGVGSTRINHQSTIYTNK